MFRPPKTCMSAASKSAAESLNHGERYLPQRVTKPTARLKRPSHCSSRSSPFELYSSFISICCFQCIGERMLRREPVRVVFGEGLGLNGDDLTRVHYSILGGPLSLHPSPSSRTSIRSGGAHLNGGCALPLAPIWARPTRHPIDLCITVGQFGTVACRESLSGSGHPAARASLYGVRLQNVDDP